MKRKLTKADESPEFQSFWSLWMPHARQTDGRGLARQTFFQHVLDGADPQEIVDGAAYFIRTLKDKAFIPLASSWINREAYSDLAELEHQYQSRAAHRASQASNVVQMAVSLPKHHFLRQQTK